MFVSDFVSVSQTFELHARSYKVYTTPALQELVCVFPRKREMGLIICSFRECIKVLKQVSMPEVMI
jgi:hypothetical protein